MSIGKGDNGGGLLSKVVKFVRNPATSWSDLDSIASQEDARDSGFSKQALKEMIERKRRNDFVRKREFDMLRKLRRSEVRAGSDPAARPSFFQSSMPSRVDDRASTLKKIDEIEAQMSQQWWKTRGPDAPRSGGMPLSSHLPLDTSGRSSLPAFAASPIADVPPAAPIEDMLPPWTPSASRGSPAGAAPTVPASVPAPLPLDSPLKAAHPGVMDTQPAASGFSLSKAAAFHVDERTYDPMLEEVAIRFANGDDDGAEVALRDLVRPGGDRENQLETWLTLFDFFRATGRQASFEDAAVDFARRFGRSAPQWMSLPVLAASAQPAGPVADAAGAPHWSCPPVLTVQGVASLEALLARAPQPWRLDWHRLERVDDGGAEMLLAMMARLGSRPVELHFQAADVLARRLQAQAPSGDRSVSQLFWRLRLEALRVMQRPDEFELVALDYCVTYEVSPPSWESPRSRYRALGDAGALAQGLPSEPFADTAALSQPGLDFDDRATRSTGIATADLFGVLRGDTSELVKRLDRCSEGTDLLVIACGHLVRVDFAAAGGLLNWAAARQGQGLAVHFADLHRLLAIFFGVVGISEQARVSVRRD